MKILFSIIALALMPATASAQSALILISNDDGYESEDLRALARGLNEDFIVVVAAPRSNQSGTSGAISGLGREAEWSEFAFDGADQAFWIDATPALSVHWGIELVEQLYGRGPDLVISGINAGSNDGQSHHYSGTVGAARAAHLRGYSALAVSLARGDSRDPDGAAEWVNAFAADLIAADAPVYLNINMPLGDLDADSASLLTYPAERVFEIFDRDAEPVSDDTVLRSGTARLWYRFEGEDDGHDNDQAVLERGLISVTPLRAEGFDPEQAERLWESQILD